MNKTASVPLTLFSFGYEGWGSRTKTLVETMDAVETARGFLPPVFVDARLRRAVRAIGFRDKNFEKLLGPSRHVWMPSLGNLAILDDGPWRLKDPAGIDELITLAAKLAPERRRVVFFCSCGQPPTRCHRHGLVAKALEKRAREFDQSIAVVEWPGGSPARLERDFDVRTFRALRNASARAPEGDRPPPTVTVPNASGLHGLAWGSTLTAQHGSATIDVLVGPPLASALGWHLPILGPSREPAAVELLRTTRGYAPLTVGAEPGWADAALYTLLHVDRVAHAARTSTMRFTVGRRMTSAAKLLAAAHARGEDLGVVIGDAVDCSAVLAVARVVELVLRDDGTDLAIDRLRLLTPHRTQQELRLTSTGLAIARGFIRPYALVQAPKWLAA